MTVSVPTLYFLFLVEVYKARQCMCPLWNDLVLAWHEVVMKWSDLHLCYNKHSVLKLITHKLLLLLASLQKACQCDWSVPKSSLTLHSTTGKMFSELMKVELFGKNTKHYTRCKTGTCTPAVKYGGRSIRIWSFAFVEGKMSSHRFPTG